MQQRSEKEKNVMAIAQERCPYINEIEREEWTQGFIHGANGGMRPFTSTTNYEGGRLAGIRWDSEVKAVRSMDQDD